jgi:hypothetical protein
MKTTRRQQTPFKPLLAAALLFFGCSAPDPIDQPSRVGALSLALQSSEGERSHELRSATFEISGASSVSLQTNPENEATTLDQELPVGDYTVELAAGWALFELGDADTDDVELDAVLLSDNPTPFTIDAAQTTRISYRFEVAGRPVELATGSLEVSLDVSQALERGLIFTEFSNNPAEVVDSDGEWLELQNIGRQPIDLQGCSIERDATSFTVSDPIVVEPGAVVTAANGETPGFTPDIVYSGVTLPNSAVFVLTVRCGAEMFDSITVDPSIWPGASGVAASLDAARRAPDANDDPANWCNATANYNTDLGTPGSPNPACL